MEECRGERVVEYDLKGVKNGTEVAYLYVKTDCGVSNTDMAAHVDMHLGAGFHV